VSEFVTIKRKPRGGTGYSRSLNDRIFKPGKGRSGWGAWDKEGRLLATQTDRKVLELWYPGSRIERLEK
jgi:hypothetical protein